MALTFENTTKTSPPSLTDSPVAPSQNVSRVIVRPPFILHKLDVSKSLGGPRNGNNKKPLLVIRTGTENSQIETNPSLKGFRVYSRKGKDSRNLSGPSNLQVGETKAPSKEYLKSFDKAKSPLKGLTKSLSQTALPNISLNTLSRNHYKTVIGSSNPTSCSFSTPPEFSYRFVINTKEAERSTASLMGPLNKEIKKEMPLRQPAFVSVFPDDSNTDSELESIFGDSFKFTRPKTLFHKN